MQKRCILFLSVFSCLAIAPAFAQTTPKFKDYPATEYFEGERASALQDGLDGPVLDLLGEAETSVPRNLAGKFVFITWPSGTKCAEGAAYNVKTGDVYRFPYAACLSGKDKPFHHRLDSRLLVLSGKIGELDGEGAHFFEFTGREFRYLGSRSKSGKSFRMALPPTSPKSLLSALFGNVGVETIEPAAGPVTDICGGSVRSVQVEEDVGGRRLPIKPTTVSSNGLSVWEKLDRSKKVVVWCVFENGDTKTKPIPEGVTYCKYENSIIGCYHAIKDDFPNLGRMQNLMDEDVANILQLEAVKKALATSVAIAIHRPRFNADWISDTKAFDYNKSKRVAEFIRLSSMKRGYSQGRNKYVLMYNNPSDLFVLIMLPPNDEAMVGFLTGREVSEDFYKVPESKQYLENILQTRPLVVQRFFQNFSVLSKPEIVFSLFKDDEARSIQVNRNLLSSLQLSSQKNICNNAFMAELKSADFSFQDGRSSHAVGEFNLTNWFTVKASEKDSKDVGIVAFNDKKTNQYGGFIVYDMKAENCKVEKIITNYFNLL